jgi:hypothetical protein
VAQRRLDLRAVSREPEQLGDRKPALSLRAEHDDGRVQGGQGDGKVGRVGGDTGIARPEHRVVAGIAIPG